MADAMTRTIGTPPLGRRHCFRRVEKFSLRLVAAIPVPPGHVSLSSGSAAIPPISLFVDNSTIEDRSSSVPSAWSGRRGARVLKDPVREGPGGGAGLRRSRRPAEPPVVVGVSSPAAGTSPRWASPSRARSSTPFSPARIRPVPHVHRERPGMQASGEECVVAFSRIAIGDRPGMVTMSTGRTM